MKCDPTALWAGEADDELESLERAHDAECRRAEVGLHHCGCDTCHDIVKDHSNEGKEY